LFASFFSKSPWQGVISRDEKSVLEHSCFDVFAQQAVRVRDLLQVSFLVLFFMKQVQITLYCCRRCATFSAAFFNVIFKNPRETHAFPLLSTTTHKSEGTYRSTARNSRSDVNIKAARRRQEQQDSGMKAMRKHHAGIAARTRHEKLHENNKANENSESNLKQTRQSSEAQARSGKPK